MDEVLNKLFALMVISIVIGFGFRFGWRFFDAVEVMHDSFINWLFKKR